MLKTELSSGIDYKPSPWRRPARHYAAECAWRQSDWLGRQDATLFHRAPSSYLCRRHVGWGTAGCSCGPWTPPRAAGSDPTTTDHVHAAILVTSPTRDQWRHDNNNNQTERSNGSTNPDRCHQFQPSRSKVKVRSRQNLITYREHHNTYCYQATSICGQ